MIPAGLDDLIPMEVLVGTLWTLIVVMRALLLVGGVCFLVGACFLVAMANKRGSWHATG
ncbi:MAG TPA: hypothetical protein VLE22_04460 [Bryobacteraceae bacterium]|nr:hypothetical protein [Bryobacteraceae bacterium]